MTPAQNAVELSRYFMTAFAVGTGYAVGTWLVGALMGKR